MVILSNKKEEVVYAKKLWEQLNKQPNVFAELHTMRHGRAYGPPFCCICQEPLGYYDIGYLEDEDGRVMCSKCINEQKRYTTKW